MAIAQPKSSVRISLALLVACALLVLGQSASAQGTQAELNQIKAAFVVNIARFVKWPDDSVNAESGTITLCIYRDDNLVRSARSFNGQVVDGRQLTVQKVSTVDSARSCGVLLVPSSHLDGYIADMQSTPPLTALTVVDQTDVEGPLTKADGTMVTLVRNKAKIGFEVNLAAVDDSGLKISAQLLRLARSVHRGEQT